MFFILATKPIPHASCSKSEEYSPWPAIVDSFINKALAVVIVRKSGKSKSQKSKVKMQNEMRHFKSETLKPETKNW